ncbi:MAG: hypothetical protein H6817_09720 [Phycisphaerales bacterium]|nr:hypothetical protein [Phycisphaerales bacterium]
MYRRKLLPGKLIITTAFIAITYFATGCASPNPTQRVIFLDGAGHLGAGRSVKSGLRGAGYRGEFKVFHWQSGLLWGVDHLIAARNQHVAQKLADQIEIQRRKYPEGFLSVMGLSAGTGVVLNALALLPDDIDVDSVALFQPSVSATHNLAPAMRHVRGKLYATCSGSDAILGTLLATADGGPLPPAGKIGFRVPLGLPKQDRIPYARVVNLPWRKKYRSYGWGGGHVSSTRSKFVKNVIAPRVLEQTSAYDATTPQVANHE